MVLTAAQLPSPRRSQEAALPSAMVSSPGGEKRMETNFGFDNEILDVPQKPTAATHDSAPSPSADSRPLTPRELRQRRLNSIQSRMDLIEASMSPEDYARVQRLASQGAIHYQSEEDFLNTPLVKRTRSAPTSSLAERYERLRSCTSPNLFSMFDKSAVTSPGESCEPTPRTLDMMPSFDTAFVSYPNNYPGSLHSTLKPPIRIIVKSVGEDEVSAPAIVPSSPSDIFIDSPLLLSSTESKTPNNRSDHADAVPEVPDPSATRMSKKRGSDPHILIPDKLKKKKRFFRRASRERENSESSRNDTSPNPHSWRQRVRQYVMGLLRR